MPELWGGPRLHRVSQGHPELRGLWGVFGAFQIRRCTALLHDCDRRKNHCAPDPAAGANERPATMGAPVAVAACNCFAVPCHPALHEGRDLRSPLEFPRG